MKSKCFFFIWFPTTMPLQYSTEFWTIKQNFWTFSLDYKFLQNIPTHICQMLLLFGRYFQIAASWWDWAQMNFLGMRRFSNYSFMMFIWFMVGSWSDEWVSSSMAVPLNFMIRWKYLCSCTTHVGNVKKIGEDLHCQNCLIQDQHQ